MSELAYLKLMAELIDVEAAPNRTAVSTRSVFGRELRFDCSESTIPIMTTKKVAYKTAFKEMLWMLEGGRNIRELIFEDVHIWNDWPLKNYNEANPDNLLSMNDFVERIKNEKAFADIYGDLGPVYGYTWRKWPTSSGGCIDQVQNVLDEIKTNPTSRRIIWEGWNVAELDNMALPPCHKTYQFNVDINTGELDLAVTQRSCDIFLGVPFNIANAALVLHMVAAQTGYKPRELVWYGMNVHLYENHIEQAKEQLTRYPKDFPKLQINPAVNSLFEYLITDFEVQNYQHAPVLTGAVAV